METRRSPRDHCPSRKLGVVAQDALALAPQRSKLSKGEAMSDEAVGQCIGTSE